MKTNRFLSLQTICAVVLFALLVAWPVTGPLLAQAPTGPDTSSSTTEDSTGKVTAYFAGNSISVTSRRGPFTYRLGQDLHIIGPDGKPLKADHVEVGQEVTVYYYLRNGESTVARIVVLKPAAQKSGGKSL